MVWCGPNRLTTVARVNKPHPFFTDMYARPAGLTAPTARHTTDLLLLALADAELSAGGQTDSEGDKGEGLRRMSEKQGESVRDPFLKGRRWLETAGERRAAGDPCAGGR